MHVVHAIVLFIRYMPLVFQILEFSLQKEMLMEIKNSKYALDIAMTPPNQ